MMNEIALSAFFIEAWTGNDESGFIQIFQPYGVPMNMPPSRETMVISRALAKDEAEAYARADAERIIEEAKKR